MATGSVISLVNRAALSVGLQAQISSLNENSALAQAASTLYTPTFEALGRSAPWGCLRAETTLTLLAAAQGTPENADGTTLPLPPVPWLYQYALPSNSLQIRSIVPSLNVTSGGVPIFSVNTGAPTWLPNNGQIPFATAYATDSNNNPINVLLTNQSQAIAVFTVNQPNPQIWDSLLQAAFVASLAAYFVPALSLNMPLMKIQIDIAEKMIQQARVRDGNESPVSQDHTPDFIRARRGSSGAFWSNGGPGAYGYNFASMPWPG